MCIIQTQQMVCGHPNNSQATLTKCKIAIQNGRICTGSNLEYSINPSSRWKCKGCAAPFTGDYDELRRRNCGAGLEEGEERKAEGAHGDAGGVENGEGE
jgi:hypothetical protein